MDQVSSALLMKALDGLALRSSAIAENIANGNTPAYRPVRVRFEEALRRAAGQGPEAIAAVRPKLEPDAVAAADGLRVDLELEDAAATAGRYGALADLLSRQLELDSIGITGNG